MIQGSMLKMIGSEVQGIPSIGLYFTIGVCYCSPHLDYLVGSLPSWGEFPICLIFSS